MKPAGESNLKQLVGCAEPRDIAARPTEPAEALETRFEPACRTGLRLSVGLTIPRIVRHHPTTRMSARDDLIFLAIETTCDETAAAVLEGPRPPRTGVPRIRSSVVASQVGLHQRYGAWCPRSRLASMSAKSCR